MDATKILMGEHRVIERVLSSVEAGARRLEAGQAMRAGFFIEAAEFIKGFADGCHHNKEEGVLFPAMESAGVAREGGPIGVMLAEHEEGRKFTRAMRAAAERLAGGDEAARFDVVKNASGYVALLRQHIAKEDGVLFPMADRVIQGGQQVEVDEAFERIVREETEQGVNEKYMTLADALERDAGLT